ncbi:MAG TPA: SelT/SelW/SelH family protein [Desulfobulbus sp.]|nr:SelT/SelW/SelH family protein [Desulfobulbus sp.]
MEDELRQALGSGVEVELIPGSGGVFEVTRDGRTIFSKKQLNRFPEEGEILRLVREQGG